MPPSARILPAPCRIGKPAVHLLQVAGLSARQMLESPLKSLSVLLGGIDPANDFGVDAAAYARPRTWLLP